jgi:hypothetical protein
MKRLLLSLIMGMSLNAASSIVEFTEVQSPYNDRLFHDGSSFMIQRMGKTHEIPSYNVNRDIRSYDMAALVKLQEHGYFDIQSSVEGNEHRIDFKPRLKAGGPIGASIGVAIGSALTGLGAWLTCKAIKGGVTAATGSKEAGDAAVVAVSSVAGSTGAAKGIGLKIIVASGLFFSIAIPF